jgi:hypothetical protein
MPILDLQQRAREIGRIRIGITVEGVSKAGKPYKRPSKLDKFRFTSHSKEVLEAVAALYGGTVEAWTPPSGIEQWQVVSTSKRLPIMVPPQPITQWYEKWSGGGCVHRCDGVTNVLTDEPCDRDGPDHEGAKPTTRLNVVLRDVVGVGVWRLESHGMNAAMELPAASEFLASAGGYVNGWLSLEARQSKGVGRDGLPETRNFIVPVIEIDVTPAELMEGKGRVSPQAIGSGGSGVVDPVQSAVAAIAGPTAKPETTAEHPMPHEGSFDAYSHYLKRARAATTPEQIQQIGYEAHTAGVMTEELSAALLELKGKLEPVPDSDGVVDAEIVPDPPDVPAGDGDVAVSQEGDADALWLQIVAWAGGQGWSTEQLGADFADSMGFPAGEASAAELSAYLDLRKSDPA